MRNQEYFWLGTRSAKSALAWLTRGSGQLAVGGTEVALFAKSRPTEPFRDIQF